MLLTKPTKKWNEQMPQHTESIESVRRERDRLTVLRKQIREALAARGTQVTKRALKGQEAGDRT